MKLRLTTWLLAALTLSAAIVGLPASRTASPRASDEIVSAERKNAELPSATLSPQPRAWSPNPYDDAVVPSLYLDQSLFQRPPPASLLFHA